jgi:murein DD-endopeptidase MepM/ murein hydrolase activator NlpD
LRLPLLLCGLALAAAAGAQTVYKIVRPDGSVHYTDRRPEDMTGVESFRARAEQQSLARLRVDGQGGERVAVVGNAIHGPLQVELRFESARNVGGSPALPLRALVPALAETRLSTLRPLSPQQDWGFGLRLSAVPGDPAAQPEDVEYAVPLGSDAWRIGQGWNGAFSHAEPASRYAIDFAVAEGTPVLAAREGVVMQVEDNFEGAGLDREKFGGRANLVRLLHADGSMAVYAHLQPDSVLVRPGARVQRGQRIAASGNTGFSSGPHLHFVLQVNRGMRLEAIPFRMSGVDGAEAAPLGAR